MMRPMKLAGDQLVFGQGSLKHLRNLEGSKAVIVLGSDRFFKNGLMEVVGNNLKDAGIKYETFIGVESDPGLETVKKGAKFMLEHEPDLIIALGGGSVMDATKAMWVFYEHPEIKNLDPLKDKHNFPTLRNKARLVCVPTTSGTASEVSRSVVITDDETHIKHGIGNMEMMPDIAICAPEPTMSMPKSITAQTGMDALCHALEAYVSNRANYLSDTLARKAILDIFEYLPVTYEQPNNLHAREMMMNASFTAGMAFTNVSLGITHSMAHSLGSHFDIPHGLANAVLLPYVVRFNTQDVAADERYRNLSAELGKKSLYEALDDLNEAIGIPSSLSELIENREEFVERLDDVATLSVNDGCTKTNPIIPDYETFKALLVAAYDDGPVPKAKKVF